jgi:hypothetical protein
MSAPAADTLAQADLAAEEALSTPPRSRRRRVLWIVAGAILTPLLVAAVWPVTFDSREELFEIPKGTWAHRMAGEKHEILPSTIHLVVGVHDTLTLKNSDDVPQIFGPTLLMPGQTFRLPFPTASENYFACTAHASGQLIVSVEAAPAWPWDRVAFRVRRMLRRLSEA